MRIVVSGTHGVGKSTLIEEVFARLPDHLVVEEPFYVLEEQGHEFSMPPTYDDFLLQLRQAIRAMSTRQRDVLFDRCPLDFLGYLAALRAARRFDPAPWIPAIKKALRGVDLLVYIPIIPALDARLFGDDDDRLRRSTDEQLQEIIVDDRFGLCGGIDVMELSGPLNGRAERVMRRLPANDS